MLLQMRVQILAVVLLLLGSLNVFADPQRPADANEVMDFCLKLQDNLQSRNIPYQLDMNACIDAPMIVALKMTPELDENLTIIGRQRFAVTMTSTRTHKSYQRLVHFVCSAPMTMDGQTDARQISCDDHKKMPERQF